MKKSIRRVTYDKSPTRDEENYEHAMPLNEFENREEWIAAMYRAPPRRLFTLADFVVETTPPPVIVRRNKLSESSKDDIEVNQIFFNFL